MLLKSVAVLELAVIAGVNAVITVVVVVIAVLIIFCNVLKHN